MRDMVLSVPREQVPSLQDVMEAYVEWGLARCGGDVAQAADLLRVSRDVIKNWGFSRSERESDAIVIEESPAPVEPAGDTVAATAVGYVLL